jgi:hypothetical protein
MVRARCSHDPREIRKGAAVESMVRLRLLRSFQM